jgi:hypothetical protein
LRAGNELAKRTYAKERAEKQAAEDARIEAQQARIDAEIAAFKKRARGAFPGNDAQFEAAWPRILEDHRRSRLAAHAPKARPRKQAHHEQEYARCKAQRWYERDHWQGHQAQHK